MILLVLVSILAAASADCDACISGRCHTKQTLLRGLQGSSKMALDRDHNILYIPLDSGDDAAFYFEDLKVQLLPIPNTVAMTVDNYTQALYAATNDKVYKLQKAYEHTPNSNITLQAVSEIGEKVTALMAQNNIFMYVKKCCKGVYYFDRDLTEMKLDALDNYTLTDLAYTFHGLYFVANKSVYKFNWYNLNVTKKIESQNYVLSSDFYDNVYIGDSKLNVIFKLDRNTEDLLAYGSYKSGSVDKFIFDKNGNVLFYDHTDLSVNLWKIYNETCHIDAPHDKYLFKEDPNSE